MITPFPTRTRLLSPFAALALLAGVAASMAPAPAQAGCFNCLGGSLGGFIGGLAIGAIAGSAAQRAQEVDDPEPYAQPRQRRVRQQPQPQAEAPRVREPKTRAVKQQPKPAQQVASKSVAPVRQANVPSSGSLQP